VRENVDNKKVVGIEEGLIFFIYVLVLLLVFLFNF